MAPPGGLFVARHGDLRDTTVVSTPQIELGLQGLIIEPNLRSLDSPNVSLEGILELLLLWGQARIVGPLAAIRRARIVSRLTNCAYAKLCGNRWAQAEAAFLDNPESLPALQNLERSVGSSPGFPVVLRRDHERMEAGIVPGTQWYTEVARRYGICTESTLCALALRIASQPEHLLSLADLERHQLLRQVNDNVALMRGARLVALLSATRDREAGMTTVPRWKW
jgi:hypothetical protein